MQPGSFSQQIGKFGTKTSAKIERVRKGVIIKLFNSVIKSTPVDKGRCRANWNVSNQQPDKQTSELVDPTGNLTTSKITDFVLKTSPGDKIFLTNSLPYAEPLEHGHSGQHPEGMVRVNVARFNGIIKIQLAEDPTT